MLYLLEKALEESLSVHVFPLYNIVQVQSIICNLVMHFSY